MNTANDYTVCRVCADAAPASWWPYYCRCVRDFKELGDGRARTEVFVGDHPHAAMSGFFRWERIKHNHRVKIEFEGPRRFEPILEYPGAGWFLESTPGGLQYVMFERCYLFRKNRLTEELCAKYLERQRIAKWRAEAKSLIEEIPRQEDLESLTLPELRALTARIKA